MPHIHSITSQARLKRIWLPALLLIPVTQAFAAGLDWSPYPEDNNKDAQKAKAAEIRAKTAKQRAADLERRLKAAEEKTAKAIPLAVPPSPDTRTPAATPTIATTAPAVLAPLSVFRDKLKGGGEGPAMVVIPAGGFDFGSSESKAYSSENPVRWVSISQPFAIGQTEVTQREWRQVMGGDPAKLKFKGCDDCPVEGVNWEDAQSYIKKLNEQIGKTTYRLPSQAEWEYACRGGKAKNKYCGGDDVDEVAWYVRNSNNKTHAVAEKQRNAFGLYDMNGNVSEWMEDWHHWGYQGMPTDGRAWLSGGEQKLRVVSGGGYEVAPEYLQTTTLSRGEPDYRSSSIGFRVARTLP